MYTLLAYGWDAPSGHVQQMIESENAGTLVRYARSFTRDPNHTTGSASVVICRGGMESALNFTQIVAIVVVGQVFRPLDWRGMWRATRHLVEE